MDFGLNFIGDYIAGETLGSGTTGKVKLASHKVTGEQVAIKIIKKSLFQVQPMAQTRVHREIALMRLMNHSSLLKLIDVRESSQSHYLILEYAAHGELFNYAIAQHHLDEFHAMHFFRQILYGIEYLHSHAICHRDLKLENILLDEFDNIKIADFGFARWVKSNIAETPCGSPHYAAPEVIRGVPYDGRAADIWSCGVILYALLTGRLPFDDSSIRAVLGKVKTGRFAMPLFISPDIQDLIAQMLCVDTQRRITIAKIKIHPAFRIGINPVYILPTPRPIVWERSPVSEVDETVLAVLTDIGCGSENDIVRELQRTEFSMEKVFYAMYYAAKEIEAMQWAEGINVSSLPNPEALTERT
jgi:BR serine/threonine kinase